MPQALAPDFSLRNLTSAPGDRASFCRKVLGTMGQARKEFGALRVRLGRTGTGVLPNYRLESADGTPLRAYDGNNHQRWPDDASFGGAGTWSTVAMTYEEVQAVLADADKRG